MMSGEDFPPLLKRIVAGDPLDAEESARAFGAIMTGSVSQEDIAAFLTAQSERGPTVGEITGAARAMRASMLTIEAPPGAIDLCGTGGDGHGTLNISTAVSFVVAACGVPVAKHGNRNMSSKTGAADVLEALGVKIDLGPHAAEKCLQQAGVCFLFAQTYHPAMKHVAAVRRQLGIRTIFNLLGPLSSPARVKRQLLGVYAKEWLEPVAEVLKALGTEKAWVVHGRDGLDEMTTTEVTHLAILDGGNVSTRGAIPEDAGLTRATLAALKGGAAEQNADAILRLLAGEHGAYRDIVLFNSAAALNVAGKARDLREGVAMAQDAIDSGSAQSTLEVLISASTEPA
jgi:anthranilate phosphoribosyltransferase